MPSPGATGRRARSTSSWGLRSRATPSPSRSSNRPTTTARRTTTCARNPPSFRPGSSPRSEEHTSELQSRLHLVCRLLLEKKKIKERILVIILLLHFLSLMLGSVLVLMLLLLVWLTPDLSIYKSLLKCNWTIRKRLPRCKMRTKKRLLAFNRRLHDRIRKTRYMLKMRCLGINRRSLLLAWLLLFYFLKFPSNSRFPRFCPKCLLNL